MSFSSITDRGSGSGDGGSGDGGCGDGGCSAREDFQFPRCDSSTVLQMHDVTVVTAHVSMQLDGRLRSEEGGMRILVRERTLRAQLFRFLKSSRHLPMPRNEMGCRGRGREEMWIY